MNSFCLRWGQFKDNIVSSFRSLKTDEDLVDVTFYCEGKKLTAHQVILSACSPFFRGIFKERQCRHPVFYMQETRLADLSALLQFVYTGSVNVTRHQLAGFIRTAELLQVSGLCDQVPQHVQQSHSPTPEHQNVPTPLTPEAVGVGVAPEHPHAAVTEDSEEVMSSGGHAGPSCGVKRRRGLDSGLSASRSPRAAVQDVGRREDGVRLKREQGDESVQTQGPGAVAAEWHEAEYVVAETVADRTASPECRLHEEKLPDLPAHSDDDVSVGDGALLSPVVSASFRSSLPSSDRLACTPTPLPCPLCGQRYQSVASLHNHMRVHTGATRCSICGQLYSTLSNLKRHMTRAHDPADTAPITH